jgi:hypothetical protein
MAVGLNQWARNRARLFLVRLDCESERLTLKESRIPLCKFLEDAEGDDSALELAVVGNVTLDYL